ncbi:MAG: trigger factor [Desulfovibrionaceae bacterium]
MEFSITKISPTEESIQYTISPEEMNTHFDIAVTKFRSSVELPGFRRGKIPAHILEQRLGDKIIYEVADSVIRKSAEDLHKHKGMVLISEISFDSEDILPQRNSPLELQFSYEILPEIELPSYKNIEASREETPQSDILLEKALPNILANFATTKDSEKTILGNGSDVAIISLQIKENGEELQGYPKENFQWRSTDSGFLKELNPIIQRIPLGETVTETVTFSGEGNLFVNRTCDVTITLHAIQEISTPKFDEAFALQVGEKDLESLRTVLIEHLVKDFKTHAELKAQKDILDTLLQGVHIDVPRPLLDHFVQGAIESAHSQLEAQGFSLEILSSDPRAIYTIFEKDASNVAKGHIFLINVALQENLELTDTEVSMFFYQMAMQTGQDYKKLVQEYKELGIMNTLRQRLLADKAMRFIYDAANITELSTQE